jgi:hypothetical protein
MSVWQDARQRSYRIQASIVTLSDQDVIERDQLEFVLYGLANLPDHLAAEMLERFGSKVDADYFKLWKRRLQVLRGSLSYHNGKRGTVRLPVHIQGEDGFIRVVAQRLDSAEQAQVTDEQAEYTRALGTDAERGGDSGAD